jgi:hypothetical protein
MQQIGQQPEHAGGGVDDEPVGARRHQQQRDPEADNATKRYLQNPVVRGCERTEFLGSRRQQHDRRGERRNPIVRTKRRNERQRGKRNHEPDTERDRVVMRDEKGHNATRNRTPDRSDQAIKRCLDRSADTRLHDDDRRKHRPIALREREQFRKQVGRQTGDSHARTQAQRRAVGADPATKLFQAVSIHSASTLTHARSGGLRLRRD